MSTNGQTENAKNAKPSFLDAPLEGAEIKPVTPGSYPGRLVMISEPFDVPLPEQFRKASKKSFLSGREDRAAKMNLIFAVKLKDGSIGRAPMMVSAPEKQVWNTSNLWPVLETLAQGDGALWGDHGLVRGATLRGFLGRQAIVEVENRASKRNAKQVFTEVRNIAAPMDGLTYPTEEEGLSILAAEHAKDADGDLDENGIPF